MGGPEREKSFIKFLPKRRLGCNPGIFGVKYNYDILDWRSMFMDDKVKALLERVKGTAGYAADAAADGARAAGKRAS